MSIATLKKRPEFMRVRGGRRWSTAAFLIECKARPHTMAESSDILDRTREKKSSCTIIVGPRFGFTITKKIGNAVVRNRIRRRLKAVLCELAPQLADPSYDYVVLARRPAFNRKFADIKLDMRTAFQRLHVSSEGQSNKTGQRPQNRRRHRVPPGVPPVRQACAQPGDAQSDRE